MHSAKRRHQSPEWTILSHSNCFIQRQVIGFQVLLDSLHPRTTRASWWSPAVLKGVKLLKSSWHLFCTAFVQYGRTERNDVYKLITLVCKCHHICWSSHDCIVLVTTRRSPRRRRFISADTYYELPQSSGQATPLLQNTIFTTKHSMLIWCIILCVLVRYWK